MHNHAFAVTTKGQRREREGMNSVHVRTAHLNDKAAHAVCVAICIGGVMPTLAEASAERIARPDRAQTAA